MKSHETRIFPMAFLWEHVVSKHSKARLATARPGAGQQVLARQDGMKTPRLHGRPWWETMFYGCLWDWGMVYI